jgi:VanZ family protein
MSVPRSSLLAAWLPPLLYCALIWWLSSQVLDIALIASVPLRDRGVHFLEYGALGLMVARAVQVTWGPLGMRGSMFAVLLSVALGLLDEFHQLFVPGRTGEILDLVADGAGVCVAVGMHALWTTRQLETPVSG